MKKIVLIFFFLLSFWIWNVFAEESLTNQYFNNRDTSSPRVNTTNSTENTSLYWVDTSWFSSNQWNSSSSNWGSSTSCAWWEESLCSADFKINTSLFSPGWNNFKNKSTSKQTIDQFLTTLIQKLMIALWSIALFVMIIWSWFMIFAMWKDDNLNKWKTIFKAWIIALVIALSSYMMVSLLKYILYANN